MPSTICGWCGTYSHMRFHAATTADLGHVIEASVLYTCDFCQRGSLATFMSACIEFGNYSSEYWDGTLERQHSDVTWRPARGETKLYDDVPEHIAAAASAAARMPSS